MTYLGAEAVILVAYGPSLGQHASREGRPNLRATAGLRATSRWEIARGNTLSKYPQVALRATTCDESAPIVCGSCCSSYSLLLWWKDRGPWLAPGGRLPTAQAC